MTPLMAAVYFNSKECTTTLLNRGADHTIKIQSWNTLDLAVASGKFEAAEAIEEAVEEKIGVSQVVKS